MARLNDQYLKNDHVQEVTESLKRKSVGLYTIDWEGLLEPFLRQISFFFPSFFGRIPRCHPKIIGNCLENPGTTQAQGCHELETAAASVSLFTVGVHMDKPNDFWEGFMVRQDKD